MRDKGVIYEKCKQFSIKIIGLCRTLEGMGESIISKQIIRSATSMGANYSEALGAESDNDFVHKISVSLKETHETQYWLDILKDSNYITEEYYNILYNDAEEIYKMLTASVITVRKRIEKTRQPLRN